MAGIDRPASSIALVPYDPRWPALFESESARLREALGPMALRIDHHGSTAVSGLIAKPIIDMQISVAALQPLSPHCERLASVGYVHVPHADDTFCPFFHRPAAWPHTHHIHLVEQGSDEERRTLAFRDYLRTHPDAANEYAALKTSLAGQFAADSAESREGYAAAKTDFVERIVAAALSAGYPR